MRPKGLIAGLICFSPAKGPGDTKVPSAGQALGGAQFPRAANRSYCFWIAAYASSLSAGPNSTSWKIPMEASLIRCGVMILV